MNARCCNQRSLNESPDGQSAIGNGHAKPVPSLTRTREFGLDPEDLAKRRKDACFPTLEDLRGALGQAEYDKVKNSLTESSNYFRATVWVTIGTTQFTLYSLLARGGGGAVRPALRSFGSE